MQPLKSVSRETLEKLKTYQALLEKWQAKINLISPATLPDAWSRHFEDSAQLAPLLPLVDTARTSALRLYDLGTGAGFPGLVLAMMRPDLAVTLVESDSKKCAFLQTVSRETKTPVTVDNRRIEAAAADVLPLISNDLSVENGQNMIVPDIVTARALASLDVLLGLCAPWIKANPNLILIFPKGIRAGEEILEAKLKWRFDYSEAPSATENGAKILRLSNVARL